MKPQIDPVETERTYGFYFLMIFMFMLTTFIGFKFAGVIGAIVGFLFAVMVNGYALKIKFD